MIISFKLIFIPPSTMQLIYIGIAFFLFKAGENMLETVIRPQIVHIICLKQLYNNLTVCSHLHHYREEENSVQEEASLYLFLYRFTSNLPSAVSGILLGAWSDTHGRGLPMISSCIGTIIGVLIYIGSMQIKSPVISVWGVLFGTLVQGSFGKNAVFTTAVNCLIAEKSDAGSLTKHTGMIFSMNYFGQCLGAFMAGLIIDSLIPYFTVIVIHSIAVFVILFLIKETKCPPDEQTSVCPENPNDKTSFEKPERGIAKVTKIEDPREAKFQSNGTCIKKAITNEQSKTDKPKFLLLEGLKSYLNIFTRERKHVNTSFLVVLVIIIFTNACDLTGVLDILLLYVTRHPFNWTSSLYSYFLAYETIIIAIFLLVVVPVLSKKFNVSDFKLIFAGLLCKTTRYIATGFCTETWMIFALEVVWAVASFVTCLRSILGKCVEQEELGKIYSLYSVTEIASKLTGSVVYMLIYGATVSINPSITFFVMGLVNFAMLLIVIKFHKDFRRVNALEMTPIILEKTSSEKYTEDRNIRGTQYPEK